jgi:SAM-dependent MidA family methyltransferase
VDLTAHVDFRAMADAADSMGVSVHGPLTQREFLSRLGIERRADTLKQRATAGQAAEIDSAVERLLNAGTGGMGQMFKAIAFTDPKLGAPPGFEQ